MSARIATRARAKIPKARATLAGGRATPPDSKSRGTRVATSCLAFARPALSRPRNARRRVRDNSFARERGLSSATAPRLRDDVRGSTRSDFSLTHAEVSNVTSGVTVTGGVKVVSAARASRSVFRRFRTRNRDPRRVPVIFPFARRADRREHPWRVARSVALRTLA